MGCSADPPGGPGCPRALGRGEGWGLRCMGQVGALVRTAAWTTGSRPMETKDNVRSPTCPRAELLDDYDFVTSGPDGGCWEFS